MAPPKRKNLYNDQYEKEFQGIKKSKSGDDYAHCVPCKFDICLTSIGKNAISHHQKTEKHRKAAKAANTSKAITSFMPNTSAPTNLDRQTAAAEGKFGFLFFSHKLIKVCGPSISHDTHKASNRLIAFLLSFQKCALIQRLPRIIHLKA